MNHEWMKFTVVVVVVSYRVATRSREHAARQSEMERISSWERERESKSTFDFCHLIFVFYLISFHFTLCFHPIPPLHYILHIRFVPCVFLSFALAASSSLSPFIKRNAKCRKGENTSKKGNEIVVVFCYQSQQLLLLLLRAKRAESEREEEREQARAWAKAPLLCY